MLNHAWHSLITILIHKKNRIKFLDNSVKEIEKQSGFISHTKRLIIKQGQAELNKLKVEKAQVIKHLSDIIWGKTSSQLHSVTENRPGQDLTGFNLIDKVTEAFYFEKQAIEYIKGNGSLLPGWAGKS